MFQKTVALLILGTSLCAQAQSSGQGFKPTTADAYVEVSLNTLNYSQSGLRVSPTALRTVVGKHVGPTFAYEGMLALGPTMASSTADGQPAQLKIDPLLAGYLKARKELAPGLEVFGRLGAASMVKKTDGAYFSGQASSERLGSVSYGLGVKIRINRDTSFVTDYTSYYNRKDVTVDGLSLGLSFAY